MSVVPRVGVSSGTVPATGACPAITGDSVVDTDLFPHGFGTCMNDDSAGTSTEVSRRRLLAGGASVATVGLAGCLGTRDGEVPKPTVTSDRIDDGWRLIEESTGAVFEESYGPVTVRALESTEVYEYVDVAEAIAETFDADGSPVVFFATRIDLRPALDSLPGGIVRERLMAQVEVAAASAFHTQLRESGIENIEVVDEGTTTVTGGHTATAWVLEGEFAFDGDVPLPDGSTGDLSESVEVRARLAVWHDGTDVLVAGGAFPTEPLSAVIDDAVPDPLDGDEVLEEVTDEETRETLATDSDTFDEEISALIVSVE